MLAPTLTTVTRRKPSLTLQYQTLIYSHTLIQTHQILASRSARQQLSLRRLSLSKRTHAFSPFLTMFSQPMPRRTGICRLKRRPSHRPEAPSSAPGMPPHLVEDGERSRRPAREARVLKAEPVALALGAGYI